MAQVETDGLKEEVIAIRRVAKVLKGGRRFAFSAIVSVGDGKGSVGIGMGKAREVPDAIRKAVNNAKKNMFSVPVVNGTIPHAIFCKYKAGRLILKPAAPGTGLIAGISIRPILGCAGITDVLTKSLGSTTPMTMVKTAEKALKSLRSVDYVQQLKEEAK
ncbi:MAG: 30S ribosomal protein S5 [Spirochaetes bacterium]|nr:30S ribosomal protein S5 [Spirochaetota bacterium]